MPPPLTRLLPASRRLCTPSIPASSTAAVKSNIAKFAPLATLSRAIFARLPETRLTFLVGGPGSGKGTLSAMLHARLGHHHVSVGELLRREAACDTPLARRIAPILQRGGIVHSSVAIRLLLDHLARHDPPGPTCVVDGFPRKLRNAQVWEGLGLPVARVVALDVDDDVMRYRLSRRGRVDDLPHVVCNRILDHRKEWHGIVRFYRERGLLTLVDGNDGVEDTWQRFLDAIPDDQLCA